MKVLKILIIIISLNFSGLSQLTDNDKPGYTFSAGANGNLISGNVERLLILASLSASYLADNWAVKSFNTYQYGEIGNKNTENDFFSRNFFYLYPKSDLYPYIMFWWESNKRKAIDSRYQIGAGITAVLMNKGNTSCKISLTLTHENAVYDGVIFSNSEFNGNNNIAVQRITGRIAGKQPIISGNTHLLYEMWYQADIKNFANNRFYLNASLDFNLYKGLSVRLSYNYNFESVVISRVKKFDSILLFGINFSGEIN
ncbi:MAG: DUF481 domain-containing protein [Ignavibacteriaceae bacterium]|nr:DUF481 domain-containing protein [Ignavibacteriaceae bacterium]